MIHADTYYSQIRYLLLNVSLDYSTVQDYKRKKEEEERDQIYHLEQNINDQKLDTEEDILDFHLQSVTPGTNDKDEAFQICILNKI